MRVSFRRLAASAAAISAVTFVAFTAQALEQGSTNKEAVKTLQRLLKSNKVYGGAIDGKYGPGTTKAVSAYQKKKGLSVDGKVGKSTWGKLIPYKATLKKGSEGIAVRWLQTLLSDDMKDSEITIDGKFGEGTKINVIDLQRNYQLTADGKVGRQTWAKLKD
ncbi:MAG: peptidoglycan-binding domain-containing protein [Hyphomicrobium sp.]